MVFQIRYTEPALADLEEICARSWEQHPENSERFATGLLNHVDLLKEFPRLGAPVEDQPEIRRLLHFPLHIYYRISQDEKRIDVLHFWHTSRKPPRLRLVPS